MQKASGEVEEVTRGLIDKHVASSLTKEDAILSFLSTLNVITLTTLNGRFGIFSLLLFLAKGRFKAETSWRR